MSSIEKERYFAELTIFMGSGEKHRCVYYSDKPYNIDQISLEIKGRRMYTINDNVSINPDFISQIYLDCRGKENANDTTE